MPHHVLRDRHIMIHLPIMHLELESNEIGQDRCAARLRFDWRCTLAGLGGDDWEAVVVQRSVIVGRTVSW